MKNLIVYLFILAFIFSAFLTSPRMYTNKASGKSTANDYLNTKTSMPKTNKLQSVNIPNPPTGLTSHSAMTIIGDGAISAFSSGGDGSGGNPYQIKNWNFTLSGTAISITNTSKSIVIENCYFNTNGGGTGIDLTNASNIVMKYNYFENIYNGIYGYGLSTNDVITNNTFVKFNSMAINIFYFQNLAILSNYLYWSSNIISGSGININFASSVELGYNYINNAYYSVQIYTSNGIKVYNNLVLNSFADGLSIQNCVNSQIYSNNVTEAGVGILLSGNNATLNNNDVSAWISIQIGGLRNSVIKDNNILNSGQYGFSIGTLTNSIVEGNFISNSTIYGMYIADSNENIITHNTMQKAQSLLYMLNSNWNLLTNNSFSLNYNNGTELQQSNGNSIINSTFDSSGNFSIILFNGTDNKVIENTFHGSKIYDVYIVNDKGSIIERNEFLNINAYGGSQAFDNGISNTFSFNYWAGWTNPDKNGDGFVDYARLIDGSANSYDNYSLVSLNQIANPFMFITTSASHKASPGFTVDIFLMVIPAVAVLVIIKRKQSVK